MSTSNPIEISYHWDKDNFEKAFSNSYAHEFKNSARRYIGWFFIAMAQFGVVGALKGGSIGLLMLSTILILYWYGIKKWMIHRRAVRAYENSSFKNSRIKLEIIDEGISQGQSFVSWEDIKGLVPIEDDILLYYKENAFYIPASAFKSIEEKSALKSIAKTKGRLFHV